MSYHEGSNWQARKEDEGKPLYENEPKKQIESPLDALRSIDLMFDQMGEGYSIKQIRGYVTKSLRNHHPPSAQQPVDALALCKKMAGLLNYLVKNDYIDTHRDEAKSYVDQTTALFSGSQASNQSEERDLWQEIAMIIYEHNGKLVATIDRLKERYHITPKTKQHD